MSKKEIMAIVAKILQHNEIKATYENGICIVSKNTAFGRKPVIYIDDNENEIEIDGIKYKM